MTRRHQSHSVRITLAAMAMLPCAALTGCSGNNSEGGFLASLAPPKPGQVARDAFNLSDPDRRRKAVALLSSSDFGGEEPYLRMYRLLIDDPDATVRAACAKALGTHGQVDDVPLLVRRLEDESNMVRWQCAQALQKIHNPVAVSALTKAMANDESEDVRMASATALGQYAQPAVFNALVAALDDTDFSVVSAAHRSLKTLTGYNFGSDGRLWLIWADRHPTKLFEHRQQYVWQPFHRPPGFLDNLQFWKSKKPPDPRQPTGVEPDEDSDDQPGDTSGDAADAKADADDKPKAGADGS